MYLQKKILLAIIIKFMVYCCVLCSPPNLARPPRSNGNQLHYMRPPAPPPPPEPSFMARIANWFYNPFGYESDAEPAGSQIDQQYIASNNIERVRDIEPTTPRTTVDTISNVTPLRCHPCNKIPWIPMIPTYQMPLLNSNSQSGGPYPASVGFKHHFSDDKPYSSIPTQPTGSGGGYNYPVPSISTLNPVSVTPVKFVGYNYAPQVNTPATVYGAAIQKPKSPPSTVYGAAIKPEINHGSQIAVGSSPAPSYGPYPGLQSNVTPVSTYAQSYQPPSASYGRPDDTLEYKPFQGPAASIKPIKLQAFPTQQNFNKPQSYYQQGPGKFKLPQSYFKGPNKGKPQSYYPSTASTFTGDRPLKQQQQGYYYGQDNANIPITTIAPQTNTIDTSVILLTTPPPKDSRPSRFTASSSVTNVEYLPPPNVLPLEHESANFVPIPIPNLSATPIPPLFNAQSFHSNPYLRPNPNPITNFVPIVPDSVPQLSNTVNVQSNEQFVASNIEQFGNGNVELVQSIPVAEFTTTVAEFADSYDNRFITSQPVFKITDIDLDLNNKINEESSNFKVESNTMVNSPIVVEDDSVGAGSENTHKSNAYGGFQNNDKTKNGEQNQSGSLDSVAQESSPKESSNSNEQRSQQSWSPQPTVTTTENNIIVEFQPSVQTSEDLAHKIKQKLKVDDSLRVVPVANIKQVTIPPFKPIGKITIPIKDISTTSRTTTRPVTTRTTSRTTSRTTTTEASAFQPLRDFTKKITQLWGSSALPVTTDPTTPKIRLQTQSPISTTPVTSTAFVPDYTKQLSKLWTTRSTTKRPVTTTTAETTSSEELTTLSFISTVLPKATTSDSEIAASSGAFAGITAPQPPNRTLSTKKPKQIQIIIPYTTYHKPAPFKIPDENDEPLTYPNLTRLVIPIRGHYITHSQNYRKGEEEKNEIKNEETDEKESDEEKVVHIPKPGISYNIQDILEGKHEIRDQVKNEIKKDDMFNGHGYQDFHNDQEYPDHAQESQIIEAKVKTKPTKTPSTRKMTPYYKTPTTTKKPKYISIDRKSTTTIKPTKYITKIVAANIRELLKKERTPKPNRIDILRLQKNIDGWTEQSFSGKASTISLGGYTKPIPREYLTSTMRPLVLATTLSTLTTFNHELMEETKKQYERILYKNEENLMVDANAVKRNDVTSRFLDKNHGIVLFNNNLTYDTNEGVEIYTPRSTEQSRELWNKFPITESPLTRERVYVVTPQPLTPIDGRLFKSPRFAIRPTPGTQKPNKKSSKIPFDSHQRSLYFGRIDDDDSDLPKIETNVGHSKVVRIVTPDRSATVPLNSDLTTKSPNS